MRLSLPTRDGGITRSAARLPTCATTRESYAEKLIAGISQDIRERGYPKVTVKLGVGGKTLCNESRMLPVNQKTESAESLEGTELSPRPTSFDSLRLNKGDV